MAPTSCVGVAVVRGEIISEIKLTNMIRPQTDTTMPEAMSTQRGIFLRYILFSLVKSSEFYLHNGTQASSALRESL